MKFTNDKKTYIGLKQEIKELSIQCKKHKARVRNYNRNYDRHFSTHLESDWYLAEKKQWELELKKVVKRLNTLLFIRRLMKEFYKLRNGA